jgi:hypothetical protein
MIKNLEPQRKTRERLINKTKKLARNQTIEVLVNSEPQKINKTVDV